MIEVTKLYINLEFLSPEVICPCSGANIHVQNQEKIFVKSEFKAVLLKLTAYVQSNNSSLRCSKFTPLEVSGLLPMYKNGFLPPVPLLFGVSLWNFTKGIEVTNALYISLDICHLRLSALAWGYINV